MLKHKNRYIIFYWCFLNLLSEVTRQGTSVTLVASNKEHQFLPHAQLLMPQNNRRCFQQCSYCAQLNHLNMPTSSTCHHSSKQPAEKMSNSKHFKKNPDDVHILFYTSTTTGPSYLHTAVQINSFHVLYHCKTFPSTSLHTTQVWAQPEFIWFLCCINFWSQRVSLICSPPLTHVAHATVAS